MNPVLSALSEVYLAAADGKNALYDRGWRRPVLCGKPVISIGNLTVGGTGKTPIVDFCLRVLLERGHRPGVVVRSYRASAREPGRVDPALPRLHGDEACWYARRYPGIPVWAGPVKTETARALVAAESVDVVLVDDGFQHRALARNLDLLLVDATDAFAAYQGLPAGRGRERFEGWKRADAIFLTKTNLAEDVHVAALRRLFSPEKPLIEFRSALTGLEGLPAGDLVAVSGIARPESFLRLLTEVLPDRGIHEMRFADHHPYGPDDVRKIEALARSRNTSVIVTTEKDETKLRPLWRSTLPLRALSLEVTPTSSVESFYELLRRAFR